MHKASRSLAIYAALVTLYPRRYLRAHRAEMLQNFEDSERTSSSKAALWLFLGRDFLISLAEEHMKASSPLRIYVIAVLLVWAGIFVVGYFAKGSTPGHPVLHVFFGFVLGMIAMYIATRVYPSRREDPNA